MTLLDVFDRWARWTAMRRDLARLIPPPFVSEWSVTPREIRVHPDDAAEMIPPTLRVPECGQFAFGAFGADWYADPAVPLGTVEFR